MVALPDGLTLRPLAEADMPRIQALLDACESADTGEPCVHEMDLAVESRSPRFDLRENTWVVLERDDPIATGWIWAPTDDRVVTADFYVHPGSRDKGLDGFFLEVIEARARACAGDGTLIVFVEPLLATRRAEIVARGFTEIRQIFQMRLDITGRRPAVGLSPGLAIRTLRPGEDDERIYSAHEEAFSEHFLFWPTPYDEWRARTVERESLDPEMWLVAWDGDEVAGQVWVLPRGDEMVVEDLSVRKPWRGRGLGLALLEEAFRVLAERGPCLVRLFVDAQNATGALRVYLRAGMREERRFEVFEKRLA